MRNAIFRKNKNRTIIRARSLVEALVLNRINQNAYRITGNFGLLQNFRIFRMMPRRTKIKSTKILHSKFLSRRIHVYLSN